MLASIPANLSTLCSVNLVGGMASSTLWLVFLIGTVIFGVEGTLANSEQDEALQRAADRNQADQHHESSVLLGGHGSRDANEKIRKGRLPVHEAHVKAHVNSDPHAQRIVEMHNEYRAQPSVGIDFLQIGLLSVICGIPLLHFVERFRPRRP